MNNNNETQLGIDANIASILCYVLGWITGIIFLFIEENKLVKFHAIQSIAVFGGITVIQIILLIIAAFFGFLSIVLGGFAFAIASLFSFISTLVWIATFILWVILMVKAYQGERFKLPLAGNLADKYT